MRLKKKATHMYNKRHPNARHSELMHATTHTMAITTALATYAEHKTTVHGPLHLQLKCHVICPRFLAEAAFLTETAMTCEPDAR